MPEPFPTIRRAVPDDAPVLADLARRTFRDTFAGTCDDADLEAYLSVHYGPNRQRFEIECDALITLVADPRPAPLSAFAQIRLGDPPIEVPDPTAVELMRFYVDTPWHGRGLAHCLMDAVIEAADAEGADTLWLGVWERNFRAQAFYRKFGFEVVGSHPFVVGNDVQTDWLMAVRLDGAG